MIVGQNQAGFTLQFAPSDATVVDVEFKALPNLDGEGTLVNYVEEIVGDGARYTVRQNLTHVTSDFSDQAVSEGDSIEATLTADSGYTIDTPVVTMAGNDITSTTWNASTGKVTIASVTGNVVITATATED